MIDGSNGWIRRVVVRPPLTSSFSIDTLDPCTPSDAEAAIWRHASHLVAVAALMAPSMRCVDEGATNRVGAQGGL